MSFRVAAWTWIMVSQPLVMAQKMEKTTGWSRTGKKKNQHKKFIKQIIHCIFKLNQFGLLCLFISKVKNLNLHPNKVYNLPHHINFLQVMYLFVQNVPVRSECTCYINAYKYTEEEFFFFFSSLHIVLSAFWPVP